LLTPWCSYEPVKQDKDAVTSAASEADARAALRTAYATRAVARRVPVLVLVALLSPVSLLALAGEYVFHADPLSLLSLALLQLHLFRSLWFAFLVFIHAPYAAALLCLVWWQPSHAVQLSPAHRVSFQ